MEKSKCLKRERDSIYGHELVSSCNPSSKENVLKEALDIFFATTLYEKHRTITLYPYTVNGRIQITERD